MSSPLDTRAVDQLTPCPFTDRRDSNPKDSLARLWGPKESASISEGRQDQNRSLCLSHSLESKWGLGDSVGSLEPLQRAWIQVGSGMQM